MALNILKITLPSCVTAAECQFDATLATVWVFESRVLRVQGLGFGVMGLGFRVRVGLDVFRVGGSKNLNSRILGPEVCIDRGKSLGRNYIPFR